MQRTELQKTVRNLAKSWNFDVYSTTHESLTVQGARYKVSRHMYAWGTYVPERR